MERYAGIKRSVATLLCGNNKLFLHDLDGVRLVLDKWGIDDLKHFVDGVEGLLGDAGGIVDKDVQGDCLEERADQDGCARPSQRCCAVAFVKLSRQAAVLLERHWRLDGAVEV